VTETGVPPPADTRDAWRRRWRAIPRADQRVIEAALRRGEAADDPALAPLAAEAAAHRLHDRRGIPTRRRVTVLYGVLAVVWLILGLSAGDPWRPGFALFWVVVALINHRQTGRVAACLERAYRANREVAAPAR
jgi:hypothetical protein